MSRTFVMGDIHGAHKALLQCLDRSGFNRETDALICLGDVCDGWPETKEAIDELLTVKHLTYLLGNHDYWALQWMDAGIAEEVWLFQGGRETIESYSGKPSACHHAFLRQAEFYVKSENTLFVHAGFDVTKPIHHQPQEILLWDRTLANLALSSYLNEEENSITPYNEVYIGHTPTPFGKPVQGGGVWLMDTGAGWSGVLSMMDIDTKEIVTSDLVPSLYPGVKGRSRF